MHGVLNAEPLSGRGHCQAARRTLDFADIQFIVGVVG